MHLLTTPQQSPYGRGMSAHSTPARTHSAPVFAGRAAWPAAIDMLRNTIAITTTTTTRSGWVSVRE